jgi:hypothetical protein
MTSIFALVALNAGSAVLGPMTILVALEARTGFLEAGLVAVAAVAAIAAIAVAVTSVGFVVLRSGRLFRTVTGDVSGLVTVVTSTVAL